MPTEIIVSEETLKRESLTVIEQAKAIVIVDQASYDTACSLLLDQIKPFRAKAKEYFDSMRIPAHRAYKAILDRFNEADAPLEQAEIKIKGALAAWSTEQERKRQELQRQAELEARRVEEESRANAAAVAEETGATEEEVAEIVNAPSEAVAAPVVPTYVKTSDVTMRDNWSGQCRDIRALCRAIGAGKVSTEYVQVNQSSLNARARADKSTLNLPGCIAINQTVVAGRTRG